MANATSRVKKGTVRRTDEFITRQLKTLSAETTFYANAGLGLTTDGYAAKFDDTASLRFDGVVRGREGDVVMAAATAGDAGHEIDVHQPLFVELTISGVAKGDIGKKVYALDDQTGTLSAAATTYGNLWGVVEDLVFNNGGAVSGVALVRLAYEGKADNRKYGAARVLAATGAHTLTKYDLNKTIIVPSTGAYTLNLPAVADTQSGDEFRIVKTTANAVALTIDPDGAETIDGASTLATIDAQYDTAVVVSTGSEWVVLARDIT